MATKPNPLYNVTVSRTKPQAVNPGTLYAPDYLSAYQEAYRNPFIEAEEVSPKPVQDAIMRLAQSRIAGADLAKQTAQDEAKTILDAMILTALGPELFRAITGAPVQTGMENMLQTAVPGVLDARRRGAEAQGAAGEIEAQAALQAAQAGLQAEQTNAASRTAARKASGELAMSAASEEAKALNEAAQLQYKLQRDAVEDAFRERGLNISAFSAQSADRARQEQDERDRMGAVVALADITTQIEDTQEALETAEKDLKARYKAEWEAAKKTNPKVGTLDEYILANPPLDDDLAPVENLRKNLDQLLRERRTWQGRVKAEDLETIYGLDPTKLGYGTSKGTSKASPKKDDSPTSILD